MMTTYLAFQSLENNKFNMDSKLKISSFAANQKPSVIGLNPGQIVKFSTVLDAIIIKSANDAAVTMAENIAGSESRFASLMNKTAKSLGMNHTSFYNASGLPNNRQVTTAYDLARLAIALRRDFPQYYHLFAKDSFTFEGRSFFSHNRVTISYRGADGLKTGYIRASGFNLVTSAIRGDKSIVGVVMGGRSIKSRDQTMVKLLDQAFYKLASGEMNKNKLSSSSSSGNKQRDIFAPERKGKSGKKSSPSTEDKLLSDARPVRVKIAGKKIPLPTFRPIDETQDKGLVNNISPRSSININISVG